MNKIHYGHRKNSILTDYKIINARHDSKMAGLKENRFVYSIINAISQLTYKIYILFHYYIFKSSSKSVTSSTFRKNSQSKN